MLPVDLSERGRQLERRIEGDLGLNKSQAAEQLRAHFGRFDYKTLGRLYAGTGRITTLARVEQWAEDQLRLRAVAGGGDDVEVTGQSEKNISLRFKGVKVSGSSIDEVEAVVPIEYRSEVGQVVRDVMRELMRETQGANDPEGDGG